MKWGVSLRATVVIHSSRKEDQIYGYRCQCFSRWGRLMVFLIAPIFSGKLENRPSIENEEGEKTLETRNERKSKK